MQLTTVVGRTEIRSLQMKKNHFYLNRRSSGMLRGLDWELFTDVSGQPIGPIFKGQRVKEYIFLING
jgi:hypothetical protein